MSQVNRIRGNKSTLTERLVITLETHFRFNGSGSHCTNEVDLSSRSKHAHTYRVTSCTMSNQDGVGQKEGNQTLVFPFCITVTW